MNDGPSLSLAELDRRIAIARDMLVSVRHMVQGAQISAPQGKYAAAVDVLEALGSSGARAG